MVLDISNNKKSNQLSHRNHQLFPSTPYSLLPTPYSLLKEKGTVVFYLNSFSKLVIILLIQALSLLQCLLQVIRVLIYTS